MVEIEDVDWAARSQAHLTHVRVGRLVVAPPWDIPPGLPHDTQLIVIPPSMGFGTGHHETTRLCLALLQDVDLRSKRVVDVGTGSGVLAIAAVLLGAGSVEGIDYDEDALTSARQSVAVNGLNGRIRLRAADIRSDRTAAADVVTANLTGALLVAVAPALASLADGGGSLILSGFQPPEAASVARRLRPVRQRRIADRRRRLARRALAPDAASPVGSRPRPPAVTKQAEGLRYTDCTCRAEALPHG